ncbi:hypothetical protein GCM10027612_85570 [Microbispora bryophytorum subsp. camponoti]
MSSVITLLTDYGLEDGFVAACHGVIAGIAPQARIIDVGHLVPAGDVRRGAAILAQTLPYLPAGIHLAVVDPAVGGNRRPVAVEAGDGCSSGRTTASSPGPSAPPEAPMPPTR